MNIGIDIDNTIGDTFRGIIEYYVRNGHDVNKEDLILEEGWVKELKGIATEKDINILFQTSKDFLDNIAPYPATRAILSLSRHHHLHLITARPKSADISRRETYNWLKKHNIIVDSVTHTDNKPDIIKKLEIDVMIEDSPYEVPRIVSLGIPILLLDQPYNQELNHESITRFTHWLEIPTLIKRLTTKQSQEVLLVQEVAK